MPAFVAPNLRGESEDARFLAGMTSYSRGDYRAALATLSQVPASIPESRAARFYSGVCQMHLGDLPGATANLTAVADAGDSPEQEAALYYLAQTSLLANDLAAAHHQLLHTITLKGDLERRARQQDRKVLAQIEASRVAADGANRTAKP
jgi:thioredoxin-like negative regulator of GroEL